MKFKILFTSKNNYELLENWINHCHGFSLPEIINLDLFSSKIQKSMGEALCKKFSIKFIQAQKTEFQHNLKQVFSDLKNENEFLLYLHQDCFPVFENTFLQIDSYIEKNDLTKFGCIGFNNYHDVEINHFNPKKMEYMTTSRCVLQKGNGYYMRHPKGSKVNYKNFKTNSAFAVENIFWSSMLISSKSFFKNIRVDLDFNFFLAADDLAYQFLARNVNNIVLPKIHFFHDQKIKTKFNFPKDSPLGKIKNVEKLYGKYIGIHKVFKNKWGFSYNPKKSLKIFNNRYIKKLMLIFFSRKYINLETISRDDFKIIKKQPGLLNDFFNHDPSKGPLKYFNLKE